MYATLTFIWVVFLNHNVMVTQLFQVKWSVMFVYVYKSNTQ